MVDRVQVPAEEGLSNTPADNIKAEAPPENFPEKFLGEDGKPDYAKLAKSYNELEKAFSRKQQINKDGTVPGDAPEDKKAAEEADVNEQAQEEATEELKGLLPGFSDEQIEDFSKTAFEQGQLTDEQYDALADKGFSREIVDQYIQGQLALYEMQEAQVINAGGGKEQVDSMFEWARNNLTPEQIKTYDDKFANGGAEAIMAMEHLKAKYESTGAHITKQITGANGGRSPTDVYRSVAQVQQDMADPRYRNDPAFRKSVEEKLSRSNVL